MKNWLQKTGLKFQRFMAGRYGIDALYRALLIFYLILVLIGSILARFTKTGYTVLMLLSLAVIVFAFCRVFSKNIDARRRENARWLQWTAPVRRESRLLADKWRFRKTHIFKKCPHCKAVLRLPKKKGKHSVNCPHCKQTFSVKVH